MRSSSGGLGMDAGRVAVVVEDDEDIRALLAAVLEQAGFDVHTAATGAASMIRS
jgi:DNA-binding response OmpR family regulator